MNILGIETSCDECSISVVRNGKEILSNVVATQIEHHAPWNGVVPEIASRLHVEWIDTVCGQALSLAGLSLEEGIDGIAVTSRPGLIGSLLVGLSYAKGLAWAAGKPWVGVDHIMAHLYAPLLEYDLEYPYIGLIVSGGHTIICRVDNFDKIEVLGTTIDDACGEAFDKVAKHYGMGYPGGVHLDQLAEKGRDDAFQFPQPSLHKGNHSYDVSYSGLKTAAVNQLEQFQTEGAEINNENIAASFRKAAIDMLVNRLERAVHDTGIRYAAAGGGVSANRYLRRVLSEKNDFQTCFSSLPLCTDNGAMIAGLGYHYLLKGEQSALSLNAQARTSGFRRKYPA
ncbi:MAG: tRNA (adenosine(37)-N6)-threonylcarbamoyltransferase complex transferase subunit TsaD [Spirochaeta sp. LUC14_002_19_P3]|nr:MAG: tRNA (adenosine(37)-N6)-threonylcarbamoyltransferase complex transferase subunit TsaD [Spirochaeta sp. LUC14_002_19_P3]